MIPTEVLIIVLVLYAASLLRGSVRERDKLMIAAALCLLLICLSYVGSLAAPHLFTMEVRTAIFRPALLFFCVAKILHFNRDWLNRELSNRLRHWGKMKSLQLQGWLLRVSK